MVAEPTAVGTQHSILSHALNHARRGWPVFPVRGPASGGKTPLTRRGHLDATTDPDTIQRSFQADYPGANYGIATGPAGLVVVDIDPRHDGPNSWSRWCGRIENVDQTMTVRTGGGGVHLYYLVQRGLNGPPA